MQVFKYFQDVTKIKRIKCRNSKKDGLKKLFEKSKSPYLNNMTSKRYPIF